MLKKEENKEHGARVSFMRLISTATNPFLKKTYELESGKKENTGYRESCS